MVTLPDGTAIEYVVDALGRRVGKRVHDLGIDNPPEISSLSLTAAILHADIQEREANRRHDALLDALRRANPEERADLLKHFIASEPIGFYRNLACRALDERNKG